jgi:hypothetical protein
VISRGQILGALVRVVAFTPVLVAMYLAFARTEAVARVTLGPDGLDPGAVLALLAATPEAAVVVPVAAVVAALGPYLPSPSQP